MGKGTLLLSDNDVRHCLDRELAFTCARRALQIEALEKHQPPVKLRLPVETDHYSNIMMAMPAFVENRGREAEQAVAGVKWAGVSPENPARGLPSVTALLILNQAETGETLAIMDAEWLTALRTGACVAVAADLLGPPKPGVVAIIGPGAQGSAALNALSLTPGIERAWLVGRRLENTRSIAARLREEIGGQIQAVESVEAACQEADIIVMATTSGGPLLRKNWVKPGALIITLGTKSQLELSLAAEANQIVVDHLDQTLNHGELAPLFKQGILEPAQVKATLGQLLNQTIPEEGTSRAGITLCVITGSASVDIYTAQAIYKRAQELNLGQRFIFKL